MLLYFYIYLLKKSLPTHLIRRNKHQYKSEFRTTEITNSLGKRSVENIIKAVFRIKGVLYLPYHSMNGLVQIYGGLTVLSRSGGSEKCKCYHKFGQLVFYETIIDRASFGPASQYLCTIKYSQLVHSNHTL